MPENTIKKPTILIVDDDLIQSAILQHVLEQDGYQVITSNNGTAALDLFEKHEINAIVLDVEMPGMNGFEFCARIRSHDKGEHVPIIMATGLEDDISIEKAYKVGATDFIQKPINWIIIKFRIKYLLRSSQTLHQMIDLQSKNQALIHALPDAVLMLENDCTISNLETTFQDEFNAFIYTEEFSSLLKLHHHKLINTDNVHFEYQSSHGDFLQYYEVRMVTEGESNTLAIVRNVTEVKRAQEKLWEYAYYDELTALPNRKYFYDKLGDLIIHNDSKMKYAVYFIDLDRFKHINDTFGHTIGDELLKLVATRISFVLKESQLDEQKSEFPLSHMFSRFGGDEFVFMMSYKESLYEVENIAKEILNCLSLPFEISTRVLYITPSIGISCFPADGKDVETLLKHADIAMYKAKSEGRNTYYFYNKHMNINHLQRLDLELKLRNAIANREFVLFYQPQYDLVTQELYSCEALIRWQHPEMGIIGPMAFITIAEEIGLINLIGQYVLEEACRQMGNWKKNGYSLYKVSVNLSASHFKDKSLSTFIFDLLSKNQLEGSDLTIELTESIFMDKDQSVLDVFEKIASFGVQFSIDDFGKGYSSLDSLRNFPVSHLKIDKSFIDNLMLHAVDEKIVIAIIEMAHAMNFTVIAEGIETIDQAAFLKKARCDYVQGYLYSKPIPAKEFTALLSHESKKRSRGSI